MVDDFSILDAASADYARREMDKADAEFERRVMGDCPECGSTMVDARCTNKERHNG
jgi:ssDNA-binding Zn-finger/Zn-ribbon topoisomerase 1